MQQLQSVCGKTAINIQHKGKSYRVLYAFDPRRVARELARPNAWILSESDVRDEPVEQQSEDSQCKQVCDDRMEDGQSSHIGRGDCNVGGLKTHTDGKRVINEIPIVHQIFVAGKYEPLPDG